MTKRGGIAGRGRWVGAVLLAAGIVAVVMIRREPATPPEMAAVRPLKTMLIGEETASPVREYPGRVAAGEQVAMAFDAGGTLTDLPVREGDRVARGEVLARLDPRDAINRLDAAKAELQRAKAQFERMQIAAEAKAVSQQELSDAEAAYHVALAQRNIAQKALDDTELRASFDGIIARVLVKNFETVQARQPVLSLQDLSGVEISASIPESHVAVLRPRVGAEGEMAFRFSVVFDFLPGREFELEFREFAVEADALTQTFTAKFGMPSPGGVNILPGMACTVRVEPLEGAADPGGQGFAVPLSAVPVDGVGQYHVWLVREAEGGLFRTERRNVRVGPLGAENILVTEGLAPGDRIALAGVHVLGEGTLVRLLETGANAVP